MFQNPLPGVPSIESPFFEELFAGAVLSEAELKIAQDLRDQGYAVLDFPDPDLAAHAATIQHALGPRYPWAQWDLGAADMRIQDAWQTEAAVRALATNATLIALLSKLYGKQARPFQTLNFAVGTEQHFHSDTVHFSSMPERFMCGVWVALEDVGPGQGPLQYFAGSHRWPLYGNEHIEFSPVASSNNQETYHDLWQKLVARAGLQAQPFLARKGQALIWCANLLHGGMPHTDKTKTRWSQVTHYFFDDCAYYTPMHSTPLSGKFQFRQPTDIGTNRHFSSPARTLISTAGAASATPALGHPENISPQASTWRRTLERVWRGVKRRG